MVEESKKSGGSGGADNEGKGITLSLFPWFVYFSFTALLILLAAVFFQMQLVSLREELATLKLDLTEFKEEKVRNLRKRSSAEEEQDEVGQDIQVAHLQGATPFQHVDKNGRIGPWFASTTTDEFITLRKRNTEIEISQNGIYYVYAQVYYLTSESHNSFQILSYNGTEERKKHRHLAVCSAQGRTSVGEISCYTSFTGSFRSGDRLYLNQIEQNRVIHFTNGFSYFGVILLRKNATMKRT